MWGVEQADGVLRIAGFALLEVAVVQQLFVVGVDASRDVATSQRVERASCTVTKVVIYARLDIVHQRADELKDTSCAYIYY